MHERAMAFSGDDIEQRRPALLEVVELRRSTGDIRGAITAMKAACEAGTSDPELHGKLAQLLVDGGRTAEAGEQLALAFNLRRWVSLTG